MTMPGARAVMLASRHRRLVPQRKFNNSRPISTTLELSVVLQVMLVRYTVPLPGDSIPCEGLFELDVEGKLTVRILREAWPYEGLFHFRAHVPTADGYVYLDLVTDEAAVPVLPDGTAWVRALPLFHVGSATDEGAFDMTPEQYENDVHKRLADLSLDAFDGSFVGIVPAMGTGGDTVDSTAALPAASPTSSDGGDYWGGQAAGAHDDNPAVTADDSDLRRPEARGGLKALFMNAQRAVEKAVDRATVAVSGGGSSGDTNSVSTAASKAGAWLGNFTKKAKQLTMTVSGAVQQVAAQHLSSGYVESSSLGEDGVTGFGGTAVEAALVNLQALAVDYRTPFQATFEPHELLLERLWNLTPSRLRRLENSLISNREVDSLHDAPYIRVGPQWQQLGFQLWVATTRRLPTICYQCLH